MRLKTIFICPGKIGIGKSKIIWYFPKFPTKSDLLTVYAKHYFTVFLKESYYDFVIVIKQFSYDLSMNKESDKEIFKF